MQTSVSWILCTVTCVQQPMNNPEAAVPVKLGSYECPGTIEQHVKHPTHPSALLRVASFLGPIEHYALTRNVSQA